MSYQDINSCRFYIDLLPYYKSVGYMYGDPFNRVGVSPSSILTTTFNDNQSGSIIRYGSDNNNHVIIPRKTPIRFIGVLGHNFRNRTLHPHLHKKMGGDWEEQELTYENIINWGGAERLTPDNNGFSMAKITNLLTGSTHDISRITLYRETGYDEYTYKVGSFMLGDYFDMPYICNPEYTISRTYESINEITTYNGATFSNQMVTKPPKWVELGAWELDDEADLDVDDIVSFGDEKNWPRNQSINRSGRKKIELTFSYLTDKEMFGPNQSISYVNETPDGYDTDVDDNVFVYNLNNDVNFFSSVWQKTLGGKLPFIFQQNKNDNNPDQFIRARFVDNSLNITQTSVNLYQINVSIEECY